METSNIITRKEAKQAGYTYYFTGNPCKHGHVDYRYISSTECKTCLKIKNKQKVKKEEYRKYGKSYEERVIYKTLEIYDFQCQNCGETNWSLLNFHHVNGRNDQNKNENMIQVSKRVCKKGKQLKEYQLLCCNCHRLADLRDGTNNLGSRLKQLQEKIYPNS